MGMWIVILGTTMLAALGALVYLISRFAKFEQIKKRGGERKGRRILVATVPVVLIIALTTGIFGIMNMMVITITLSLFWLCCDLAALIVKHYRTGKSPKCYVAGICALVFTFLYFVCGWILAHHVFETDVTVRSAKIAEPLQIVLFADAHVGTTFDGAEMQKDMQRISAKEPDAVVIAGDLIDDNTSYEDMVNACRALGTLQTKYGVFFVYGNHDKGYAAGGRGYGYQELEAELTKNHVVILEDVSHELTDTVTLTGRADASTGRSEGGYTMGQREDIATLLADIPADRYRIVIDHQPNDYDAEAAAGADLVLSGHTHGGQLFPINHVGEWIGANDNTYGRERRGNTDFIITSGISAWEIPFKTGCKSEYVLIRLKPEP